MSEKSDFIGTTDKTRKKHSDETSFSQGGDSVALQEKTPQAERRKSTDLSYLTGKYTNLRTNSFLSPKKGTHSSFGRWDHIERDHRQI
jgi:hypothetical protein